MIVRAYVRRQMTPELVTLANELDALGGRLYVDLERPFRGTKPCDAFIATSPDIVAAYREEDVPAFDSAMLLKSEPDVLLEGIDPRRVVVWD